MEITIQELAGEAGGWFETAHRDNERRDDDPSGYVRTRDEAPEWVRELVRDAHGEFLPDDWRYATIAAALEALAEAPDVDDCAQEFADGNVDTYTGDRLAWLSSNLRRPGYCDAAVEELGVDPAGDIIDRVGAGQYLESLEVFESVKGSLEARKSELELDEAVETLSSDYYPPREEA